MDSQTTDIRIDLLAGSVTVAGTDARLRPAEAAVIFALAVDGRPIARDLLAEMLYPDADGDRAVNSLKVNASRARRRLQCPEAIQCSASRYALGWCIDLELPRLEAAVRRLSRTKIGPEERRLLHTIRDRGRGGRPGFVNKWEWFGTVERRLQNLVHDATVLAAQDALTDGRPLEALELASGLLGEDPADESAAEIALRASVQHNDHIGAVLVYRRFAEALESRLGVTPPPFFRLLFDDAHTAPACGGSTTSRRGQPTGAR
jgi:DNA-binding SARP family transcriptional activator